MQDVKNLGLGHGDPSTARQIGGLIALMATIAILAFWATV